MIEMGVSEEKLKSVFLWTVRTRLWADFMEENRKEEGTRVALR